MNPLFRLSAIVVLITAVLGIYSPETWSSTSDMRLSKGQMVYVSAYSNVYSGPRKNPFQLATMLSIRNVDMSAKLKVTTIDYYDNDGRIIRRYLTAPLVLGPLASHHIYLEESDTKGGFGANFIVKWSSDATINTPIIESVMIGATSGQGISFVSPGQEIKE